MILVIFFIVALFVIAIIVSTVSIVSIVSNCRQRRQRRKRRGHKEHYGSTAVYNWGMNDTETQPIPNNAMDANKEMGWDPVIIGKKEATELAYEYSPILGEIWSSLRWISQADLARLLYVHKYGGAYFDTDCWVQKDFRDKAKDHVILFIERELAGLNVLGPREKKTKERKIRIANYAFSAPSPQHPFFRDALNEAIRRLTSLPSGVESEEDVLWSTGPDLITSTYYENSYPDIIRLGQEYVIHTCTGTWRNFTDS